MAVKKGWEEVVELLLSHGADVNAQRGMEDRILYVASKIGDENKGVSFESALHVASELGHDKVVQLLLARGADADRFGGSSYGVPLTAASARGRENIVQLLLNHGADVNALTIAAVYSNALNAASSKGHTNIVQVLLARGADVHAHTGAALWSASRSGHADIVQLLLDHGADPNKSIASDDTTALIVASNHGHKTIVQKLIDRGADVSARGRGGESAVEAACISGHEDVVQILREAMKISRE